MRVISCVFDDHNLWLVALAAAVCVSGCWVTLRLFERALKSAGVLQRIGWLFQTGVAAGSSVWCTHFVAVLAYDAKAPVAFDPLLTAVSLVIAIAGLGLGFAAAAQVRRRFAPEIGGAVVGLAIPAMHYTGMAAYHVDGIVEWSAPYIAASVATSVIFGILAVSVAARRPVRHSNYLAIVLLVLSIVSLHFTAMAAVSVYPLLSVVNATDPAILEAMAVAIVAVALFVMGTGVASYLVDEHSRSENFRKLRHMAMNDALTGLPNRTSFADHLDHQIREAAEHGWRIAVVGIDLDRFKEINDLRGHGAGDEALQIVGDRLAATVRENEFAARVGGDEFGAVKPFTDQKDLLDFVSRLEKALFTPIEIDDFTSTSGASIGVAVYPEDGENRETLIGNADLAMYRAKVEIGRAV